MELKEFMNTIKTKKAGQFFRLSYQSPIQVSAKFRKQNPNIDLSKEVSMTVRTGVQYSRTKAGQEAIKKSAEKNPEGVKMVNNFVPIIPNTLYFNTNTGKHYLYVYPMKSGANARKKLNIPSGVKLEDAVNPSYFAQKDTAPIMRINVENIISIA